jgi:RNA-binding protein
MLKFCKQIKIHRTCPGELEDVVRRLEEATGSVVVGQIGRTVIIYRPSLTKMKAEEKRLQARRVYVRKAPKLMSVPLVRKTPFLEFLFHNSQSFAENDCCLL